MFERFTVRAREVVVLAQDEARALGHAHLGSEHLLLGLLGDEQGVAARALSSFGVGLETAREAVVRTLGETTPGPESASQLPFTPQAKKVLEAGLREALSLGHNYIGTEHILLGLLREEDGTAALVLGEFGVGYDAGRARVTSLLEAPGAASAAGAAGLGGPLDPRRPLRWEYRVERWAPAEAGERQRRLNELGSDGWQLSALSPCDEGADWIFRRPLPPRRRPEGSPRRAQRR